MIYLELFIGFLIVGLFSFGGAYAAIPLIRDIVLLFGWIDEEVLTNMIAVSESTPGPIMVNLATYVGCSQAGILGGIIATFAVVLPAFLIILLITVVLKKMLENKYVKAVLNGLKPCIIGIIISTGCYMIFKTAVTPVFQSSADWMAPVIAIILAALFYGFKGVFKKKMSPIVLIVISAVLGAIVYGFK
ncbi:MAG: chromate transporter [Lachnospiraceae bacterium]|nr:chromate transporter [Lachnospiraceae bacterium]MBR5066425.1 chromate transporter [Lachnospiraceae bacterium]MBR5917607.1 chromate transporter [Lachnospiraceae bacterium]